MFICRALVVLFVVFLTSTVVADSKVEQRVLNNGNLILEDIPAIPESLVNQLNRFQNVRSASFQAWTNSGDSIYVSTRFGDVSQLHKVSQAGGTRRQLTFFKEPVRSVQRQPKGTLLSFTMDAGGSENAQIFLLNPEDGESEMITDGESRNGAVSWNRDGTSLIYQSTKRNGASNDLWLANVSDPKSAKLVLESPDGTWWGARAWNSSSDKVLVAQYISINDARIHLLDLKSGKLELLAGSVEKPSYNAPVAFDRNDQGFYFITDAVDSGFKKLAYKKFGSDAVKILTEKIDWDIQSAELDYDNNRLAFAVNAGGMSEIYLLDAQSNKYKKVEGLPVGVIGGLGFSPKGNKLALSINTAKNPTDAYVLDLNHKTLNADALTRWTFSEVGGLNTSVFVEPELVKYPTFDNVDGKPRQIPAFIFRPQNSKQPAPVIISIHGGPEGQYRPRFSSTVQLWIQQLGAAVIAPNVRGSDGYGSDYLKLDNGFKREDSVKDIGALLDWIKTQPDLDSERVIVIGGSYGGYMVLASAVHYSDRLLGAVDIVGISNFVTFLKNTKSYRRDLRRVEYGDERDPKMYEHLQNISPNNHVDKIKIPLFVVQGENDPRVPVTEAVQIVKALRAQGDKVWYMNALNEGHGYRKKENRDVYQQAVVLFFKELLKK